MPTRNPQRGPAFTGRWKKFVFAADLHGDMQDREVVRAFSRFMKRWNPSLRIMGGDLWDFRPLRKKADAEEKRDSMRLDYEAGRSWLTDFGATHFLRGNHDERLYDLAAKNDGPLSDYAKSLIGEIETDLRKMKCQMLPYHKREGVLKIGHLKMVHGYSTGIYAARRHAQIYGSVLFGHIHTIQHQSIEGVEQRCGRAVGCMCQLDMDFNRALLGSLSHRCGWAYGVIHEGTGSYQVWQAEQIDGRWVLPTGIEEL